MEIKKTLGAIVLASAIGVASCRNNLEYSFNGKIGEEQVRFYESINGRDNTLDVIKTDGSEINFYDYDDDLKLDWIRITARGNTSTYNASSSNKEVIKIMKEAQEQFDNYLKKILEINTAPLRS